MLYIDCIFFAKLCKWLCNIVYFYFAVNIGLIFPKLYNPSCLIKNTLYRKKSQNEFRNNFLKQTFTDLWLNIIFGGLILFKDRWIWVQIFVGVFGNVGFEWRYCPLSYESGPYTLQHLVVTQVFSISSSSLKH